MTTKIHSCLANLWFNQKLGGGLNPCEKYAPQIGSFPQIGVKIKNVWNHHPEKLFPSTNNNTTTEALMEPANCSDLLMTNDTTSGCVTSNRDSSLKFIYFRMTWAS